MKSILLGMLALAGLWGQAAEASMLPAQASSFETASAGTAADAPGPDATLYASPFYTCVRNFYVATTGSDSAAGTQASPWLTIQHADSTSRQPGDCINVAAGTYQAQVLIQHGGNAPTATGYVAYRCETLDACHILAPSDGHLWGIDNTAFVVIDGFEIDGNNALLKDGIADACVGSDGATYGTGKSAHHIWVVNNILHHCNLAGVSFNNKEWYYVIHNTLYHNSWTSGYQGSGISFVDTQCLEKSNASCASGATYAGGTGTYVPSGMDLTYLAPFHNVVSGNIVYDNMIAPSNPVACGSHTDGNGIIMDTFLDETTQSIVYPYQTLITGNISYANGGRGIHVFRASNVTVANNTVYGNGTDTCINAYYLGDLSQSGGTNDVWINNVAQSVLTAAQPSCGTFCGDRNAPLVAGNGDGVADDNNIYLNNVLYGGQGVQLFDNDVNYLSCVTNLCSSNPLLSNPGAGNFALQASSPAIGFGTLESYLPSSATDSGACPSILTTCPGGAVNPAPTVSSVSPTSGPTTGGTAVTIAGAGFTGATTVKFGTTAGSGITVVNDGQITVTSPAGSAGSVDITVTTAEGTSGTTASDKFTYVAATAPPVAGAVSATVAYNSASTGIALNLSGATASSVAVASAPAHGTAAASGTKITYTPVAGYFGADSFTYTASNASGKSSAATVSITVSPPAISITPTTLAAAKIGTSYSQTLSASGGQSPYSFSTSVASGALPGGLTLSSVGTISGTPTASGSFTFTVTGTDSSTASHAHFTSGTISLTVAPAAVAAVVAGPVSATIGYDTSANAVTLNLSGGAAASVAVAAQASHGTATAAGTAIHYTPVAGYFGTDSFTYTATNSAGTSKPATVSIKIPAPTIAVAPTTLAVGTVGTAYSQSLSASGGQTPYAFATKVASGALPSGLSLSSAGAITGTPTASGTFTFTVSGTDSSTATPASFTSGTLSLTVSAKNAPTVSAISPVAGPTAGGTLVTITGTNLTGATGVKFGNAGGISLSTVSATRITAVAPPGSIGAVDITVTTAGGTSAVSANDKYVYAPSGVIPGRVYSYANTNGVTGVALADNSHFNTPAAGAVDVANGHLFVADTGNHRIQVIDTGSLAVIATIGASGVSGSDNAHFNRPGGVGFDAANGHILVADTGNHRVQLFDAKSFVYLSTLGVAGVTGTDNAHFDLPTSANVNTTTGQLYVADSQNQRVQVYDAHSFAYIATIGATGVAGNDSTHLQQPHDAEFNATSNQIMVADSGNSRIQLFDADSFAYVSTIGGTALSPGDNYYVGTPATATFDPTDNLILVADAGTDDRVEVFDAMTYQYVLTLGTTAVSGPGEGQFAAPVGLSIDPIHARLFVGDTQNDRVQTFNIAQAVNFASVLPGSRAVQTGTSATIFASMINSGTTSLNNCRIALPVSAPGDLSLKYQTTNDETNALTGTADTPATIAAGSQQSFVVSFQSSTALTAQGAPLDFACDGVAPAAVAAGVDTVDLSFSTVPVTDIIALAATSTNNGVIELPTSGAGAFAVASTNVGAAGTITVSVDTGTATLPVTASICQSNPSTSQCLAPPTSSLNVSFGALMAPTFSIFLRSTGPIAFDPSSSRVFVRFKDAAGLLHGSTSVAIETQ